MRSVIWLFTAIAAAQTITSNPANVVQSFPVDGAPASVSIFVSGSGSVSLVPFTQSGGNWLSVTPASGTLPLTAKITMDPAGLPDGTFVGSIAVGAGTIPIAILVGDPGPQLTSAALLNGAPIQGGTVSPGEVVTFVGSAIGPKIPYGPRVQNGAIQPKIAATRIWFGNTAASLIYAYPNEVAAVVPGGLSGTVQVQAENLVARSLPINLTVQSHSTAGPPSAISSSALAAAGNSIFNFTFTDPRGWHDLDVVNILINNFLDGRNACYLAYSRPQNVLYLVNDPGTALLPGLVLNGSGSVSNSQCTVTGSGSSAVGLGSSLTLTLNLSFGAGFAGNKIAYLAARDLNGGNSGWQALDARAIPGTVTFPSVNGVGPVRGAGSAQTFTFTFSDAKGYQDLGVLNVLMNGFLDGRNACYLAYSRPLNALFLVNDSGNGLLPGLPLNGSGTLTNSQCTINAASSSGSGNTLTLTLNVAFTPAFAGNRVIYAAARDSGDVNNSGWQSVATWSVR